MKTETPLAPPPLLHDPLAASRPPLLSARSALFLDFDGTLVAIATRPEDVVVGDWLVPTLDQLRAALDGALALVSGRPLDSLDAFVAPLVLPAAGVHGVEMRDTQGRVAARGGVVPAAVMARVQRLAALHPGLRVELKPSAIALHYREAPQHGALCLRSLQSAARPHRDWAVLNGKCVVEIKPASASKANAVRAFCAMPAFAGREPVFVGDDTTDEDGFVAVQALGGIGIKVGEGSTAARHRLADTHAVQRWLQESLAALTAPKA